MSLASFPRGHGMRLLRCVLLIEVFVNLISAARAAGIDFSNATVVVRKGDRPAAENVAPTVLTEEIARRTGLTWTVTDQWPQGAKSLIALSTVTASPAWKDQIPTTAPESRVLELAEAFSIRVEDRTADRPPTIFVTGTDPRGLLFG